MKTKLDEAREIINFVDKEMISLFVKRMNASKMVAEYKKENNLPILDSQRENALKEKNLKLLDNLELEQYYLIFFEGVLNASKEYQKECLKK